MLERQPLKGGLPVKVGTPLVVQSALGHGSGGVIGQSAALP